MAPLVHSIIPAKAVAKKVQIMLSARICADFWAQLVTSWGDSPEISRQGCLKFGLSLNKVFWCLRNPASWRPFKSIDRLSGMAIGGPWDWTSWVVSCNSASRSLWMLSFSCIVNQFLKFVFPFRLCEADLPWCVVPWLFIKIAMGRGWGADAHRTGWKYLLWGIKTPCYVWDWKKVNNQQRQEVCYWLHSSPTTFLLSSALSLSSKAPLQNHFLYCHISLPLSQVLSTADLLSCFIENREFPQSELLKRPLRPWNLTLPTHAFPLEKRDAIWGSY